MAKGFTIKAKAPAKKASGPEWDYDKAKEMIKGKTVVFCLPGRGVSYTYLKNFVQLCFDLVQAGASIQISQDYSSMVNFARCKCLGANVLRGPDQIPWDGKLKYDYQLWIDSDIVFNTEKFYQLVLMDQDIASGWYCTEDGKTTSVAHWLEEEDFANNGGVMNHETLDTMAKRNQPFTVDYAGFGWILIKHGVFENEELKYPWFAPKMQVFDSGAVQDMCVHGPMGYLVLSSPDVISALESFADYLPLRLPFSSVKIVLEPDNLSCTLALKSEPNPGVRRMLQECFALMIQAVVEAVIGRELTEATIGMEHPEPDYRCSYAEYFHAPVHFSQPSSTVQMPAGLARIANASGHCDSYAVAQELCRGLLMQIPAAEMSSVDQVRRLLLSSPTGSLTATDVAQAMYITKRTLQRRLEQEGTTYRTITEQLVSELAVRHLRDTTMTVEAVSTLLGYYDTAAFRKAFHRWYGQSPSDYRSAIRNAG